MFSYQGEISTHVYLMLPFKIFAFQSLLSFKFQSCSKHGTWASPRWAMFTAEIHPTQPEWHPGKGQLPRYSTALPQGHRSCDQRWWSDEGWGGPGIPGTKLLYGLRNFRYGCGERSLRELSKRRRKGDALDPQGDVTSEARPHEQTKYHSARVAGPTT